MVTLQLRESYRVDVYASYDKHLALHALNLPRGLAALTTGERIALWDLNDQRLVHAFTAPAKVDALSFSPDGQFLAAGWYQTHHSATRILVWDVTSGELIQRLPLIPPDPYYAYPHYEKCVCYSGIKRSGSLDFDDGTLAMTFTHDGNRIMYASRHGWVGVFDIPSGRKLWAFPGMACESRVVALSPNMRYVVTVCRKNNNLMLWDFNTGECLQQFNGHHHWVDDISLSKDLKLIASSSSWDETVRVWDIETGQAIWVITGQKKFDTWVKFSHDTRFLMTGQAGGKQVEIWSLANRELVEILKFDGFSSLLSSGDSDILLVSDDEGLLKVYHLVI